MQRGVDNGTIDGSFDGTLVVKLTVSEPGRISDLQVEESDLPNAVADCAQKRIRRVRLRRPSSTVEVTATYRLRAIRDEAAGPRD